MWILTVYNCKYLLREEILGVPEFLYNRTWIWNSACSSLWFLFTVVCKTFVCCYKQSSNSMFDWTKNSNFPNFLPEVFSFGIWKFPVASYSFSLSDKVLAEKSNENLWVDLWSKLIFLDQLIVLQPHIFKIIIKLISL